MPPVLIEVIMILLSLSSRNSVTRDDRDLGGTLPCICGLLLGIKLYKIDDSTYHYALPFALSAHVLNHVNGVHEFHKQNDFDGFVFCNPFLNQVSNCG